MWSRKELKMNAKASLKQNYWKAVIASLVLSIAISSFSGSAGAVRQSDSDISQLFAGFSAEAIMQIIVIAIGILATAWIISEVISIFLMNPLQIGARKVLQDCDSASYGDLLAGFKNEYLNVVKTKFLEDLFILLWSCLFIIPGIIKKYEYYMVDQILAENPDMSSKEIFAKSKEMMTGNKWNAFVLELSFIGWYLLGAVTCGIAFIFFVSPYEYLTQAELYNTLKTR